MTEREPARIGRRLAGIAIDWLACYAIALALFGLESDRTMWMTLLFFAVETIVFTWLLTGSFGNTLVGVQILTVHQQRLAVWRIAVRTILLCLVIPPVVMDGSGRGLHDKAVGSQAFRRPPRVA